MIRRPVSVMVLALIGLACASSTWAQMQSGIDSGPEAIAPSDPSVSRFSDDELRSFAAAALAVQQVKDTYAPRLAASTTSQEEQQTMQMANEEMMRAVQNSGMSVERFQEILDSASADPALVDRINRKLNGR
jgi:hypothetical protein